MRVTRPVTPWWFWLVAGLAVLWNLGGAADYLAFSYGHEAYVAKAREAAPEAAAFLEEMPAWRVALWAIAVWFSLAGALLLLFRRHLAVGAYLVGLVGILAGLFLDLTVLRVGALYGGLQLVMSVAVVFGAVFQVWFARRARLTGILR